MSCCCPDSPPPKRKPGHSDDDHIVTKQPRKQQSPPRGSRDDDKGHQLNGVHRDRHRDDLDRHRDHDHRKHRDDDRDRHRDNDHHHHHRYDDRRLGDRPSGGDRKLGHGDRPSSGDRRHGDDDRLASASHVRVDEKSRPSSGSVNPKIMADLEKLLERLEKVTTRLENVSSAGGGGAGSAGQDGRLKDDVHDAMRLCESVSQKLSSSKDRGSSSLRERFGRRLHDVRGRLRDLEKRMGQTSPSRASGVAVTGGGKHVVPYPRVLSRNISTSSQVQDGCCFQHTC